MCRYTLNKGNSSAIKSSLKDAEIEIFAVYLINNSWSDSMFSEILEGLQNIKSLNSIIYAQNEFGAKSWKTLSKMIEKLTQIRLIKLKTSPIFINDFLTELLDDRSNIQKLWLSN